MEVDGQIHFVQQQSSNTNTLSAMTLDTEHFQSTFIKSFALYKEFAFQKLVQAPMTQTTKDQTNQSGHLNRGDKVNQCQEKSFLLPARSFQHFMAI